MSKFRHELKFLINSAEEQILRVRAAGILLPDPHTGADSAYTIRSLYYDDYRDSCFLENENGTDPRSKFRIRYYNDDPSVIKLEKKSKIRGMCHKEQVKLTPEEAAALTGPQIYVPGNVTCPADSLMKKPLIRGMFERSLRPVTIVTYRRIPYVYPCGNVRITFDSDITSSSETEKFLEGGYRQRPVLPPGKCILEVKWDELLPDHIREAMSLDTLQQTAFSKYYYCRKFTV